MADSNKALYLYCENMDRYVETLLEDGGVEFNRDMNRAHDFSKTFFLKRIAIKKESNGQPKHTTCNYYPTNCAQ